MQNNNNVIDNVNKYLTNNVIDNDNDNYEKSKNVDYIADRIAERLKAAETSRPFLCKAIMSLPEFRVWNNVETAVQGRNPMGLFIYLCKKDGV